MSDLTDAVETMMASLADAMEVWRQVGERVKAAEAKAAAAEAKAAAAEAAAAALSLRVQALERARTPDFGAMFRGVATRLDQLERRTNLHRDEIEECFRLVKGQEIANADPDGG
ncbi:MAG: hypothetical protein PHS60_02185 [Zavarzinia sp.]|nr:hypothetical protein [Zavarzinia sp.]